MAPPRVVFLGTGGALNHERFQPSVLVEHGALRMLLDTGGGLGLVRRLLGAGIPPASIGHVFLSHRHLDHIGGLEPFMLTIGLPSRDRGTPPPPLAVYASTSSSGAIRAVLDAADAAGRRLLGDGLRWVTPAFGAPEPLTAGATITLVPVDHLPLDGGAAGCVLDLPGPGSTGSTGERSTPPRPLRIAYSGDTRPAAALAEAARGADLLIHEVGGLDADAERVHRPHHSTAGDAGRIAAAAEARALALFHLPASDRADPGALLAEARRFAPHTDVFLTHDGLTRAV